MSKSNKDLSLLVEKKLKDIKFKSPTKSKDPKVVEKSIKEVLKTSPDKVKKVKLKKKDIVKKVAKLLLK